MDNALPFPIGSQTSSALYAPMLGQKFSDNGTIYRLCKANAALTANWVVVTAYSSGVPTFVVDSTTTANNEDAIGFVPASYTSGVTSGNYFLAQISGNVTPLFATTTLLNTASPNAFGTATTAGYVQAVGTSLTTQYDNAAIIGLATNTAAVSAAGTAGKGIIVGLMAKA